MNYKEEVKKFVVENFLYGDEKITLHDETSFLENGIIDSTGVLELVSFLQYRFGVKIQDEELMPENLDSVSSISDFLLKKKGQNHANATANTR